MVSGPFDGDEVADRLTSNTGKIITDTPLGSGRGGGKQKHAIAANGCSRLAFVHPDAQNKQTKGLRLTGMMMGQVLMGPVK